MAKLVVYREASAVNYLREKSPPLIMVQGDKGPRIPVRPAHDMKARADVAKARVTALIVTGAAHNGPTALSTSERKPRLGTE